MSVSASLKADEVARFDALARDWWDSDGPMAPLHRINPLRIGWLVGTIARRFKRQGIEPLEGLSILDIGDAGAAEFHDQTRHFVSEVQGRARLAGRAGPAYKARVSTGQRR